MVTSLFFKIVLLQHSATIACICTKFDTETQNGVPEAALPQNLPPTKSKMAAVAFLKFFFNGHNSVAIARIFTIFDGETENEAL